MITDCLIIGYNDGQFEREVQMMRSMGTDHPDYRDLNLNFIEYQGMPYRAMDILDHFYHEGRPYTGQPRFHNTDVLWMVVMYLGTYLARRGFSFDYINLFQPQKDELLEKLRTREYRAAVVTTTIYNYDTPIREVVDILREHSPKTQVIVGGPYVAKRSETMEESDLKALFKYIGADFYVRSREGEQVLARLLQAMKSDQRFADIPNLAFREDGQFLLTPAEREFNPLYENLIDYSLFPREHVGGYVNVRITKGCPFTCSFCSFPLRTEKYDVSRLDYIERELNAIRDVGTVTGLFFVDDTANVPLTTFKEMMRMMIRQDYGFKWHCFFRADFCDAELVDLMVRAGCQGVFLGLESANDQMLVNMHKTPRKHHYLSVIPMFKKAGIKVFASLFFGFPGETHATAQETMDFLTETKPDFYRPLVWYCDPVTPIWKERDRYGLKGYHFSWSHDTMDVSTACDLVERCFFTFDRPLWVPDPGFNFVSLFLLQNRGMSFEHIETFLRSFNSVIREKMLEPDRQEASPHLIENLRRACQFDRPLAVEPEAFEVFSAHRYTAAEQFWLAEFASCPPRAGKARLAPSESAWQAGPVLPLSWPHLKTLEQACATERSGVLMTALATALLRLDGRDDVAVLAGLGDGAPFPVRLALSERMTFRDAAQEAQRKVALSAPHQRFAPIVLSGVFRMPGYLKASPVFDLGYLEATSAAEDTRLRFSASAYRELALILRLDTHEEGCALQILSLRDAWAPERIQEIGAALIEILSVTSVAPEMSVGDIPLATPALPAEISQRPLSTLQFNF